MGKLDWSFKNQSAASYDFTSSVQSFTYTQGRQNVLDNYGGGTCQITMRNNAGQVAAASLGYRQKVYLRCESTIVFRGWVQGIDYVDTPGNANDATAVITLVDAWVLAGQQIAQTEILGQETFQIDEIDALLFNSGNFVQGVYPTSPVRGSLDYNSDYASRLNQIVASDRGAFFALSGVYYYYPLAYMYANNKNNYSFGRTPSGSVIAYESFERVQAIGNQTFVNSAQVTPEDLATQSHTNSSASTYGKSAITVATLNLTVDDGKNTARWIANSMGEFVDNQSFRITVKDVSQTSVTDLAEMLQETWNLLLTYIPPGGVETSERTLTEGVTVRGFIDRTEVDFYLSPLTYYNYFTLNDDVFGVLNESRLGFN